MDMSGCPTGYVFTYLGLYTYLFQILSMLKVCIFLKRYVTNDKVTQKDLDGLLFLELSLAKVDSVQNGTSRVKPVLCQNYLL